MSRRFKPQSANPLTEISELGVFVDIGQGEAADLTVCADVRISPVLESIKGRDFKYGPNRALLSFQISGCEAERGARYNDTPPEPSEVTELQRESVMKERTGSIGVGTSLEASPEVANGRLSAAGGCELTAKTVAHSEKTTSSRRLSKFVKARPNLRWEFTSRNSPDSSSFLDDTYLTNHPMFAAKVSEGANQVSVDGMLYCRKGDFSIVAVGRKMGDGLFQSRNREAIMNLVIQKAVKDAEITAGLLGEPYIVLSRCKVVDGD